MVAPLCSTICVKMFFSITRVNDYLVTVIARVLNTLKFFVIMSYVAMLQTSTLVAQV